MEIQKLGEHAKVAFGLYEGTNPELNILISFVIELNDAHVQMLTSKCHEHFEKNKVAL